MTHTNYSSDCIILLVMGSLNVVSQVKNTHNTDMITYLFFEGISGGTMMESRWNLPLNICKSVQNSFLITHSCL